MVGTYAVTALDGVAFGLLLFTVASGLVLIYGVMGVLNLAHGSLYLAGAYLTYMISNGSLFSLVAALAAGILLGAGGGATLSGLMRPLSGRPLDQVMAIIGITFILADIYIAAFGAAPLPATIPHILDGTISLGDHGYPVYRLLFIAIAGVIAAMLHLTIRKTRAGIALRAVVADPVMARATGIHTQRIRIAAFAVGGMLAVAAGVLGARICGPAPGVDTTILTLSLIIVVIGGAGSIPITFFVAIIVGQVQTIGVIVAPALAPFTLLMVTLGILIARPGNLGARPA